MCVGLGVHVGVITRTKKDAATSRLSFDVFCCASQDYNLIIESLGLFLWFSWTFANIGAIWHPFLGQQKSTHCRLSWSCLEDYMSRCVFAFETA